MELGASSKITRLIALIVGLVVSFITLVFTGNVFQSNEFNLLLQILIWVTFFVVFFLLGALFGYRWSEIGWKWGLWLVSLPIIFSIFVLLVNVSNGYAAPAFTDFILTIVTHLAGACIGAYVGSEYKRKQHSI